MHLAGVDVERLQLKLGAMASGSRQGKRNVELVVALNNAMEQWSYSNCDRGYFYCDVVKAGALTIARGDQ